MAYMDKYSVAIIGAGPAGLFAAREMATQGVEVVLFNRDIKPGGLAEYGIYPDKVKMKDGLRAQFRLILSTPGIHYYGNVLVGNHGDLSLQDLRSFGFQAVLVTAGAQGTKWLGLPGENLPGVFHAKNIVYHYNMLPPFSQQEFAIGRRVAIVGVGNVMMDIAHYLVEKRKVDEVVALARRGPNEIKFDRAGLEAVGANLDVSAVNTEIERCEPVMRSVGQDPQKIIQFIDSNAQKALSKNSPTRLWIRFLSSPTRILSDSMGRVAGLEIEENSLVLKNNEVRAQGLGVFRTLAVDTVIFAVGDRVDEDLGLPIEGNEYAKNPAPRYPMEGNSYEVYDPGTGQPIQGAFVAGWSRKASEGLVGVARKDGVLGARAVMQYLQTLVPQESPSYDQLYQRLCETGKTIFTLSEIDRLDAAEKRKARELGLEVFKCSSNAEMSQMVRETHE